MIMSFDLIQKLVLIIIAALVALLYLVRVALKGRAHFDRVERQGGSVLLSKRVMEMAYWGMQPVARLLVFFHVTPNRLSWASLTFGVLAGACLMYGHFGFGATFAAISALLDSLDGMVARLTGLASDAGEVLDAAVDRYVEFFFLAGLAVYYRQIPALVGLALLALLGSFMVSYSSAKAEALQVSPPKGSMRRPERALYLILGAALSPVTIPWFETYREFSIAIGHPMVIALCLVAVMSNVSAVERLWAIAKAIRLREKNKMQKREQSAESLLSEEESSEEAAHQAIKLR
jgi:CDP-diacylglycerol---glycerol-3-phosphate 3-phosphatidyltransferase